MSQERTNLFTDVFPNAASLRYGEKVRITDKMAHLHQYIDKTASASISTAMVLAKGCGEEKEVIAFGVGRVVRVCF